MTTAKKTTTSITIPAIQLETIEVPIKGVSPLIVHKFSEKNKRIMLEKMQGKASKGRELRDPEAEFEAAKYVVDGKECFPSIGFKLAAVRAAKAAGMAMTDARAAIRVNGEFVEIIGKSEMREDTVTVGNGSTDLRYRPEYKDWGANVSVTFNKALISAEQVVNLFNIAGFGTGIGEWRPEKNGQYGSFEVVQG